MVSRTHDRMTAAAQAGFGLGSRVMQAIFLPAMALAFSAPAVAGQNFGAQLPDRVRNTFQWLGSESSNGWGQSQVPESAPRHFILTPATGRSLLKAVRKNTRRVYYYCRINNGNPISVYRLACITNVRHDNIKRPVGLPG